MARDAGVREAVPQDAEAVTDLLRISYARLMPESYDAELLSRALPLMARANPTLLASGRYFVAETGAGRLVGCGGWSLERPGSSERIEGLGHVRHFGVHPDATRAGVGRMLFEACVRQAHGAGVGRLECYASLNAEPFYRALGFTGVRPLDIPMAPDLVMPALLMVQDIG